VNKERSRAKKLLAVAKQLKAELNKLQNIATEKEVEYALKLEEYKNANESEKERLEAELEQLKDERDAEQKQNAERISQLLENLQYYKNKNDDLLALSRKKHIANEKLKKENKKLQKELENAENSVKTEVVEKEKIVEKVVKVEDTTKIQQLEKRIKELEAENVTLKQLQTDKRNETPQFGQAEQTILKMIENNADESDVEFKLLQDAISADFCIYVAQNYANYATVASRVATRSKNVNVAELETVLNTRKI
jgi:DNA repair exonuclease SbcCD ATPase subunit